MMEDDDQNNQHYQNDLRSINSISNSQAIEIEKKNDLEDYIDASYISGPYVDSKRVLTDKFGLFAIVIGIIVFVAILIYSLMNSDMVQILQPFNDSGQKCGVDEEVKQCPYSMAQKIDSSNRIFCVKSCPQQNMAILTCKQENFVSANNTTLIDYVCRSKKDNYQSPNFIITLTKDYLLDMALSSILAFYASHFFTFLIPRLLNIFMRLILFLSTFATVQIITFYVLYFSQFQKTNVFYFDIFPIILSISVIILIIILFIFYIIVKRQDKIILAIVIESLKFQENSQYLILFLSVLYPYDINGKNQFSFFYSSKNQFLLKSVINKNQREIQEQHKMKENQFFLIEKNTYQKISNFILGFEIQVDYSRNQKFKKDTILCLAILLIFIVFSISIYNLVGCGKSAYYPNNPIPTFEISQFITILIIIQSLIAFWIVSCILQIGKFVISMNSAKWYFRNEKELLSPTRESIYTCFRYHIGSIALGAILFQFYYIAQVICLIFQPLLHLVKFLFSSKNELQLSNYIYYLNCRSQTILAFTGDNLFTASKKYSKLIERSKKFLQFSDFVGELIEFDINFNLSCSLALISFLVSAYGPFTAVPIFILLFYQFRFIITYTISKCVITNWSFVIDTILVFYFIDKEANKNEKWPPVYLKQYFDEQEEKKRIQNQENIIKQLEQKKQYISLQINKRVYEQNLDRENLLQDLEDTEVSLSSAENYLKELLQIYEKKQIQIVKRKNIRF